MVRITRTLIGIAVVLALLPGACWAWGTLTDLLPMTPDEEAKLRSLVTYYGSRKKQSLAEILPRRGPHPVSYTHLTLPTTPYV